MRGFLFCFALLVGAAVMSFGCSRSSDSPKSDAPAPEATARGWASDEKPVAANPATSPAEVPEVKEPAREEPVQEEPTPEQPAAAEVATDDAPEERPEVDRAIEPPADAFALPPAVAAEPRLPPLRNPLRDAPTTTGSSNPMRRPSAPLPEGATPVPAQDTVPPQGSLPGPPEPAGSPVPALPPLTGSADTSPEAHRAESSSMGSSTATMTAKAGDEKAEEPFDPIKENGPIFQGWPRPKLAMIVTGREDGYMEPCGCAGLDRMKGGLSRRHTMIESLGKKGWPVVCVDVGGLSKGYGPQAEIKFQRTVDAMRKMGYEAIGFGLNDLQLPTAELVSVAAEPSPFVSANVGLFGFDANLTARTKTVEAGGLKVGITAVLGKKYQAGINNQEIELASPEEALAQVLPPLKKSCNLLVLLAFATKEESLALGQQFPDFQLVVTAGGPAEPPKTPMQIPGTQSLLIEVGEKGMDAIVLGFYDDPANPLRYQRVPLDSRFAASPDMRRIMVAYQEQLKRLGFEGLGIRPVSHPQAEVNGPFVGSEKCKSCHEESYRVWKKSNHAKAWKTLVEADPPRNFDPECISCHVIGWHPTKYFPYRTGFLSEKKTPEMRDVGCESCHGPGGAHCDAEDGSDLALQEKLCEAVRVTKEESQTNLAKMCQNCHDLDNSPDFNFETYWPKVEHYEEEE